MSINIDSQGGVTHIGANGYDLDRMASQGDSIMSEGISVLYQFMTLFTDLAQGKYDQMKAKADRARNSQQVANQIDAIIAKFKKAGDTGDLPPDVLKYLRDHNINITVQDDGKNATSDIDSYLKSIGHPDGKGLDKGELDVIKGALETDSGRSSDFVTQAQLQIQKTMQSYNVCVSLINSMQTLLAEMNKAIAQNIR
ncbi:MULTISPECIES: secretion protein EspA [Edwardsiella]|uniref:EspA family secreted protein n=2 Tax=Edwardsiella anguillarum TaxID=1821960 RepID=A0A076LR80_9GAMM|nr:MULTISPECIES: secretion protein EspA [Edwardsiella]AKM48564.1 secretion protein EspA [Edwardsiella sp. EA181011]GAJ67834.1 protein EseB [Edwardsiella piscicida]AIJ09187.1 EspA family secreted protein [Edwardsiella anguillarum ET080813]AKR77114.1 secretion protein EspA [Edwardsiella sp. LADL05-105]KAB0589964.1 secretion protein EspA [Edwardsiella anguillarum]